MLRQCVTWITLGEGSLIELHVLSCVLGAMSSHVCIFGSVGRFGFSVGVNGAMPVSRSVPSVKVQDNAQRRKETGSRLDRSWHGPDRSMHLIGQYRQLIDCFESKLSFWLQ